MGEITAEKPAPTRGGRRWIWLIPVLCVVPLLCCGGFVVSILMFVFGAMKSTDPYKEAVARAQNSTEVQAAIGTPVETGFFLTGNINMNDDFGNAQLSIPVSGPKGEGTITVIADKAGGPWEYSKMLFADKQGNTIDLLEDPGVAVLQEAVGQ